MSILGFLLFIVLGAISAWLGNGLFRGKVPGGFLTATIFGILGAWIGGGMFADVGPSVFGVALFPSFAGSVLLVVCVSLIFTAWRRSNGKSVSAFEQLELPEELSTKVRS